MPMVLPPSPEAEELSPTDCSEDSVEILPPRGILRPKPKILSPHSADLSSQSSMKRKLCLEDSISEEKKRRIESLHEGSDPYRLALYPSPGPYGLPQSLPVIQNDIFSLQRWILARNDPEWRIPYNPAILQPTLQRPLPFFPPFLAQNLGSHHPVFPYLPPLYAPLNPLWPVVSDPVIKEGILSPPSKILPSDPSPTDPRPPKSSPKPETEDEEPLSLVKSPVSEEVPRKSLNAGSDPEKEKPPVKKRSAFLSVEALLSDTKTSEPLDQQSSTESSVADEKSSGRIVYREPVKSYKNLTKERRMQANARERTRVHTISAAFENLRRAVPSFSHGQRLSKLSILRVATSYIMALGKLAGDCSDEEDLSLDACVDLCTKTLMTEGQMRRNHKRDEKSCDGEKSSNDD